MTKDAKKVWEVMEKDFGWETQPIDFQLDFFEDAIKATKQALILPVVVKSLPTYEDGVNSDFYALIDRLQACSEWKFPNRKWSIETYNSIAWEWRDKILELEKRVLELESASAQYILQRTSASVE